MSSARWKLLPLLAGAVLAACQAAPATGGGPQLSMSLQPAGTARHVELGATVTVTVSAANLSADQTTSTPLTGTVEITTSSALAGALSSTSVTLNASGTGTFDFTACAACADKSVVLTASMKVDGKDVKTALTLTLGAPVETPDAGIDAGPGTDACNDATACTRAACDGKSCGLGGVCVADSLSCQTGGLIIRATDQTGAALSLSALPAGAPRVHLTAERVGSPLAADASVTFSVTAGSVGGFVAVGGTGSAMASLAATANVHGIAAVDLIPSASPSSGTIKAAVTGSETSVPVSVVIGGSLAFAPGMSDAFFSVMGVASSGYQEASVLRFALVDSSGVPVPNAQVQFSVPALGGAQLSPGQAITDANGQAVTTLHSGRVPGTLVVSATATLPSGPSFSADSATIVVVGAKASARNFSVQCDAKALSALTDADCTLMHADLSTTCTAVLADRFNNTLGRSVQLTWMAESGFFGPPSQTPAAAPGADPTTQGNLGRSANILRTFAAAPPHAAYDDDLNPPLTLLAGETVRQVTDACGTHKIGPRSGLDTFIVVTQGEEAFTDLNGNGVYDSGEPFTDLGEPYLDQNDNNQRDPGEPFMDLNGNGSFDLGNNTWDSTTTIWTEGHVAFTGRPQQPVVTLATPFVDPASLDFNKVVQYDVRWDDKNGNTPAPLFTAYSAAMLFGQGSGLGSVTQTTPANVPDRYGSIAISLNTQCSGQVCKNVKTLSVDTSAQQTVVYRAPTDVQAVNGFDDFVAFTADLSDVPVTVTSSAVELRNATCNTANIDCANPACGGQTCTTGGSSGTCDVQSLRCVAGQQSSGGYVLSVSVAAPDGSPSSLRLTAPSGPLTITATLSQNGVAPTGSPSITFAAPTTLGSLKDANNAANTGNNIQVATDASGVAKVKLTPQNDNAATGDLVISFLEPAGNLIQVQKVITIVVPGTLSFTPAGGDNFTSVMGVKGSDFREQNILRFTLVDSAGQPYTGAAKVRFLLPGQTVAGNGTIQGTGLGGALVVPTDINTDSNGQAVTTLYSGSASGTLAVNATATVTLSTGHTVSVSVPSSAIAVVGAKANGRNFSVSCDNLAVPALIGNDCSFMHADMTLRCTAVVGDRYNNVLGVAQPVTWLSEAGLFGPPSTTPAAAPGADPTGQPSLGRTSNTLRTFNAPLPLNVDGQTAVSGEPTFTIANDVCSGATRQARPRDGLVTLIAVTQGEEGFVDRNGNGQWDVGENFFDLGEPFVDSNDNNAWDPEEPFVDVNGDGSYQGPNGVWDSNTTIWAVQHVAFTGLATRTSWYYQATGQVWPFGEIPSYEPTTDTSSPSGAWVGSSLPFAVRWQDENGNEPSPQFDTYSLLLNGSPATVTPSGHYIDQWGSMVVRQPTSCTASPVAGVCSAANPRCQCKLSTAIVFNQGRMMYGTYNAPTPGTTDQVGTINPGLTIAYTGSNGAALTVDEADTRTVIVPAAAP